MLTRTTLGGRVEACAKEIVVLLKPVYPSRAFLKYMRKSTEVLHKAVVL